jgi:hypothetical protein
VSVIPPEWSEEGILLPPGEGGDLRLECILADFLTQMDGDGNFDGLSAMGFSALHNFEEVSCDAATWTMVPPS